MTLSIAMPRSNSTPKLQHGWLSAMAALAVLAPLAGAHAAALPPCPAAVQNPANTSLSALSHQQDKDDQELRSHPSGSYATMNGPVIRELEKRKQREALIERLQTRANHDHHCRLQGADFAD
jgi:hypothetical protein